MTRYSGSEWIKNQSWCGDISPLGVAVADLLGEVFGGIYHLNTNALKKVDWADDFVIEFVLGHHGLSTFDGSDLSIMVILCHDRLLRLDISARAHEYLGLMFHQRRLREGSGYWNHPTIETTIEHVRKWSKPLEGVAE